MVVDIQRSARTGQAFESAIDRFRARTPRSAELADAARQVMPGGDTRTVAFHAPYPLTAAEGRGCRFVDVDGHEYIDVLNNYTSLIHGHAHPAITEAVVEQLPRGTNYATAVEAQTTLAQILTQRVASVDLIRFTNSGTEATMNAVRAARAFTGRERILKIEGGYHGTYDDFEVSVHPDLGLAGSDEQPTAVIDARGVPANTVDNVLVTPFNDAERAVEAIDRHHAELAAVIVEPVMGAGGMIPAETEFLQALRDATSRHGVLLIFDEVMTFRLEPGGMQEHYGIAPDLTTFAKIIGGGFPVGAFGGRADVMAMFDPSRPAPLWQSGTFNGNAITMTAGIAAMEHYPPAEVTRINGLGDRLRAGLADVLGDQATITGYGSFVAVHPGDGPIRNYRDAARREQGARRALHLALLNEGVFCAPRLMFCTSTAMDDATIDTIVERVSIASAYVG